MGTNYAGTPQQIEALDSYIKLLRAINSLKNRIDEQECLGDLKGSPFGVLEMLYHLGPLHQKVIGQKLLISKSNVVAVIDKLENLGLVHRQRSVEDRRCVFVHLTDEGEKQIKVLLPAHVNTITTAMNPLTQEEQRQLGSLCRKLGLGK